LAYWIWSFSMILNGYKNKSVQKLTNAVSWIGAFLSSSKDDSTYKDILFHDKILSALADNS
jgi:hypothetical protein